MRAFGNGKESQEGSNACDARATPRPLPCPGRKLVASNLRLGPLPGRCKIHGETITSCAHQATGYGTGGWGAGVLPALATPVGAGGGGEEREGDPMPGDAPVPRI